MVVTMDRLRPLEDILSIIWGCSVCGWLLGRWISFSRVCIWRSWVRPIVQGQLDFFVIGLTTFHFWGIRQRGISIFYLNLLILNRGVRYFNLKTMDLKAMMVLFYLIRSFVRTSFEGHIIPRFHLLFRLWNKPVLPCCWYFLLWSESRCRHLDLYSSLYSGFQDVILGLCTNFDRKFLGKTEFCSYHQSCRKVTPSWTCSWYSWYLTKKQADSWTDSSPKTRWEWCWAEWPRDQHLASKSKAFSNQYRWVPLAAQYYFSIFYS